MQRSARRKTRRFPSAVAIRILSKRSTAKFASVLALPRADLRLGLRLAARRWRQFHSQTGSRIELAAVASLLPLSAAVAALAAAPSVLDLDSLQPRPVVQTIATPPITDQLLLVPLSDEQFVREAHVERGDTTLSLFSRLGIADDAAARFIAKSPAAQALSRLIPGQFVRASLNADGELRWLRVFAGGEQLNAGATSKIFSLDRAGTDGSFQVSERQIALERRVEMRSGEVRGSLFGAADSAGVPDSIAQQIVDALEGQIDFHRDLQPGDSFRVVYETFHAGAEFLRPGRLLAVEVVIQRRRVDAYWFADGSKNGGYYSIDGRAMQRGFLRSPLPYTRVNSGFTANRAHPLFGYGTAHRGIDYAAELGTRVRTVAGGMVEFAGWQSGYGNVVEVRHDAKHSTLYAHLKSIAPGTVKGARLSQGDLIGLVGATGWATGPHLHFELKQNGRHVNPMTATLPSVAPLPGQMRPAFMANAEPLREQLALLERVRLAVTER